MYRWVRITPCPSSRSFLFHQTVPLSRHRATNRDHSTEVNPMSNRLRRERSLSRLHSYHHEPLEADPVAITALAGQPSNAMQIFDDSVVRGTATVTTAMACLKTYEASFDHFHPDMRTSSQRADKGGKRVLKWLWESGASRNAEDFLNSPGLMYLLCSSLVAEGDDDLILQWYRPRQNHTTILALVPSNTGGEHFSCLHGLVLSCTAASQVPAQTKRSRGCSEL